MDSPESASGRDPKRQRARALSQQLRSLQQAGVSHVARGRKIPTAPGSAGLSSGTNSESGSRKLAPELLRSADRQRQPVVAEATPAVASNASRATGASTAAPNSLFEKFAEESVSATRGERVAALQVIQHEVAGCTRCSELATTRTQTVFGVGDPEARLCLLGEAPGADEDRQGEPFVGRAGQLLNKIIEACGMRREEVYILNVLKCRPPGNRNPLPDEAANCRGFLDGQLRIIRPQFICCLGAVAARMLLDTPAPIGKLRGKFFHYGGAEVLCTYHPAFLLRNPSAKKDVWQDMQILMERIGRPIGQGSKAQ